MEQLPELDRALGSMSRFGDGDGSYWDRWLNTTGYETRGLSLVEGGHSASYHESPMPTEVCLAVLNACSCVRAEHIQASDYSEHFKR